MPGASYMLSYTLTLLQRCRLNCGSRWQRCRRTVKTRREPWAQRSCSSWDSPSRTNHEHGDGLKGLLSKGISNQTSGLTVEVEEETSLCLSPPFHGVHYYRILLIQPSYTLSSQLPPLKTGERGRAGKSSSSGHQSSTQLDLECFFAWGLGVPLLVFIDSSPRTLPLLLPYRRPN